MKIDYFSLYLYTFKRQILAVTLFRTDAPNVMDGINERTEKKKRKVHSRARLRDKRFCVQGLSLNCALQFTGCVG